MDDNDSHDRDRTDEPKANPGYAAFQISKALLTSVEHPDPATRERALARIDNWTAVVDGLLTGTLAVGSRLPVSDAPAWATLEVVTGGFATGELIAGGPLRDHEKELASRLGLVPEPDARRSLNGYHLSEEGFRALQELLSSGRYDIEVPEEGALLVVAWLATNGYTDEARELVAELSGFMSRLRFYPVPAEHPRRFGARVALQDVRTTIDSLRRVSPNARILAQKESVEVWAPLYDRMVGLFLETVSGEPPRVGRGADGKLLRSEGGRFEISGGWPCQNYLENWTVRARQLLADITVRRLEHKRCGRPDRAKDSFAQLHAFLARCADDASSLGGRDVGRIRLLLARYVTKRGTPDSPGCRERRARDARKAAAPTFHEIANVLIPRLESYPSDEGLDDTASVAAPVSEPEALKAGLPVGTEVPETLERKVNRCLRDTVQVLVERGIVTSGETLARVLPQWTSGLRAAGIRDPELRQVYSAIYRAFRRRRSLLLLNLEKQIQIEELPWVAAIDRFRDHDMPAKDVARQALEEVVLLTVASFPHAILPNKLLQELRALAKTAGLDIRIVDEIAADIFMGQFTGKFVAAAKRTADVLDRSLYATYYGIDARVVRELPVDIQSNRPWYSLRSQPSPFFSLCETRAGVKFGGWDAATSGMIIEQQQILTTQNLAVLFDELNLARALGDRLDEMAKCCFTWVCRRQQMKVDRWHALLIQLKNTAYAWRQMIFFLSLRPKPKVEEFLEWADAFLSSQPDEFRNRFAPVYRGLEWAARGNPLEGPGTPEDVHRFLGWSKERHWLLGPAPQR